MNRFGQGTTLQAQKKSLRLHSHSSLEADFGGFTARLNRVRKKSNFAPQPLKGRLIAKDLRHR